MSTNKLNMNGRNTRRLTAFLPLFFGKKESVVVMIIRQMTINDYEEVSKLLHDDCEMSLHKPREDTEKLLKKSPSMSLVCQCGNKIVGAVVSGCDGRVGYIYSVAVEREYKIRGIGVELLNEVLKKFKAEGIEKCYFFISDDKSDGEDFWNHIGWKKEDRIFIYSKSL